jgi:N-acetylmuramoyl-L-alanine amidase
MPDRDNHSTRRPHGVITFSLERRHAFRWLLLPAVQLVVPPSVWAAASRIASVRLWPAQEYTRVILEGPAPIPHQLITLKDPHRVVLDLEGVDLAPELQQLPSRLQPADPYIAGSRFGR